MRFGGQVVGWSRWKSVLKVDGFRSSKLSMDIGTPRLRSRRIWEVAQVGCPSALFEISAELVCALSEQGN